MLEQRGYTLYEDEDGLQVPHHTGWLIIPSLQVGLLTVEQWKHEIDVQLGQGQEHVQHFCGLPLLRETKNVGEREVIDIQWFSLLWGISTNGTQAALCFYHAIKFPGS